MKYSFKNIELDLIKKPAVMGILNLTPDSFYSNSRFTADDEILREVSKMIEAGADIIDIGGESSRPGACEVSEKDEIKRIDGVIKQITSRFKCLISIDTRRAMVARTALDAGAEIVNDISGFSDPKMIDVIREYNAVAVLMHMKGFPKNMQDSPYYRDVTKEIYDFFESRISYAEDNGLKRQNIWVDPGIGFGKRLIDNLEIIRNLSNFKKTGCHVLIGLSRKSFIEEVTANTVEERLLGTCLYNLVSLQNGASIIRVHDVKEAAETIKIFESIS
ncbi:MAG: dihydropteroate synthase [Spirochaetes bacterium]|nr:dihydropteroate synthase [Spirochaetota bacterium]